MEFPHLGAHCSMPFCNKLDFLPVKCDCCLNVFCYLHMRYDRHICPKAGAKDVQVPVCPLCNKPVSSRSHEPPDFAVSAHIDRECESDPAVSRRKVYTYKCVMPGCRKKEMVPFTCSVCKYNYCVSHRHPADHQCFKRPDPSKLYNNGSQNKFTSVADFGAFQGNMDEDEALARALSLSYEEDLKTKMGSLQADDVMSTNSRHSKNDSQCHLS